MADNMNKIGQYMVNREFTEKLLALTNRSTNPAMAIFDGANEGKKMRVIIDYDPQAPMLDINYYLEDK